MRMTNLRLNLLLGILLFAVSFGWQASLPAPAFFHVRKDNGVWWLVAPDGKRFFSSGVDVVDRGQKREKYRKDQPEYASFRFSFDDSAWARDTLERLRG